ncbi:DUF302 domain-containing protein [Dechloromonas hortensis]|uniref:DUF302 domain-containing protein n=1 Tax=Dechloromonas hortensis TaxID=337779 RepID=UPI0012914F00|nr:DUF302 domain-containing protein [Dechloromonas hortensis]
MRRPLALLALLFTAGSALADDWMVRRQVGSSFEETREAIVLGIENRGLVVNYTAHIADMLARTGADLGTNRPVFAKAEIIEFCSAGLSRRMMEADPHNIVLCPFSIAVYALPGETAHTWVAYRKPQGKAAPAIEALLGEIAGEAGR